MGEPFILPHGARGFEADEFAIEFREDKILLLNKAAGDHYTLHFGINSGILDVHHTWNDGAGQERHQTLFAIRQEALLALVTELGPLTLGFLNLVRPLRVRWLERHNIGIVRGLLPMTTAEMAKVTRKHKKRLVADEDQWQNSLDTPEYLDGVWDFPDGPFSLFDGNEEIGIGFKTTDAKAKKHLHWLSLDDLNQFYNEIGNHMIAAAQRCAIPPEQYGDHPDLVP